MLAPTNTYLCSSGIATRIENTVFTLAEWHWLAMAMGHSNLVGRGSLVLIVLAIVD